MKLASYQLHFLPHAYIVARYVQADTAVLTVDVDFDRNHWVHRCELPNGKKLTLPIVRSKPGKKEKIVEKRISYDDLGADEAVLTGLQDEYRPLPYFREAYAVVEAYMRDHPEYLWFLNFCILTAFLNKMGIDPQGKVLLSSSIELQGKKSERVVELCKKLGATEYVCGGTAFNEYLDHTAFAAAGVKLTQQDWKGPNVNLFELVARYGWEKSRELLMNNN